MLMTVFVVGLNAPSLPLLPLFTWALAISDITKSAAIVPNTFLNDAECFIVFISWIFFSG